MVNVTILCFAKHAPFSGPPLIQNGQLTFQAHHVGWIIAGFFTIVALIASFWLIGKHLMWYTQKMQQRYIIRVLLMVPIYATVSLASYIFWNHAVPITLVRDSYESFVLYSFFYLLLQYLSPTIEGQKQVFKDVVLQKWMFPLGFIKYRPVDGLYFLQLMKWGVLQYCVVRPATTMAAVILDSMGLYCDDSWSPGWGHVYITIIVSLSVTVAMYCLIQLYVPIGQQLAQHKPILKLFSVKAVVFLTFWQATALSALSMFGVVKDTNYMTADDINTGIAAILETFEMMVFAFLHFRAFSYVPYRPKGHRPSDQTPRLRSFAHVLDIRDMWREIRDGSVYMGRIIRGVDAEEETRRKMHFTKMTGRERPTAVIKGVKRSSDEERAYEEEVMLDGHGREWGHNGREVLLNETNDRFGTPSMFELDPEPWKRELDGDDIDQLGRGHTRGKVSWWRGIYDRISDGHDQHHEDSPSSIPQEPSHIHRKHHYHRPRLPSLDSPPPPPCVTFVYPHPRDGRSSLQLSSCNGRQQHVRISGQSTEHPIGQYYHDHLYQMSSISEYYSSMYPPATGKHTKGIVAPQLMSVSNSLPSESLAPGHHERLTSAGRQLPQSGEDIAYLLTLLGTVRPDSLLLPNPNTDTYGQLSPKCMTDLTFLQKSHLTPLEHLSSLSHSSLPLPQDALEHATPTCPSLIPMFSTPNLLRPPGGSELCNLRAPLSSKLRPNIVPPTLLSPARYPNEARHGVPVSHYFTQCQQTAGRDNQQSTDLLEAVNLAGISLEPLGHDRLGMGEREQFRTAKCASADLSTPHATTTRPEIVQSNAPQSTDIAVGPRDISSEVAWPPLFPIGTSSVLTTAPRSPPRPRELRHAYGDIAKAKRSRS